MGWEAEREFEKKRGMENLKRLIAADPSMLEAHMGWRRKHREVDFRVSLWGLGDMCDGHGMWNYYLYLREEQLGPDAFKQLWLEPEWKTLGGKREHEVYEYYISPFTDLDLHGGITFYKRHGDGIHTPRCVEIGCDYGHSWDADTGYGYDLEFVCREARHSIDLLHELYPRMNVRCQWDGTYHPREEMLTNKNGHFVWRGNKDAIPAEWNWFPETETAEGR